MGVAKHNARIYSAVPMQFNETNIYVVQDSAIHCSIWTTICAVIPATSFSLPKWNRCLQRVQARWPTEDVGHSSEEAEGPGRRLPGRTHLGDHGDKDDASAPVHNHGPEEAPATGTGHHPAPARVVVGQASTSGLVIRRHDSTVNCRAWTPSSHLSFSELWWFPLTRICSKRPNEPLLVVCKNYIKCKLWHR